MRCRSVALAGWPVAISLDLEYKPLKRMMLDLRERIIEFTGERRRFGYRQLHILLRR